VPDTIVLRFRDLVAATIPEHRAVIEEHGHVWWGWWNKPNEKIPRRTFAELRERIAAEGHVDVYLADSGTNSLYRARVTGIEESETEGVIPSPDPTRSPGYYSTSTYKAWFRIEAIEDTVEDDLREFAYDEVDADEFVEDPVATDFNGKRVWNVPELLQRHRTIYFLRRRQANDQDYLLRHTPEARPESFMTIPVVTSSNYIVHLSDLHFGSHHAFSRQTTGTGKNLAVTIIDDLRARYGDVPPAAIILSGDLTWLGTSDEFEWAVELVQQFASAFRLDFRHFVVVPGNHDIQWAEQEADYDRSRPVEVAADDAQRNYRDFLSKAFGLTASEGLAMGRRYILGNYRAVDVLGLNSSRLEQRHFAGYGFVNRDSLVKGADAMGWANDEQDEKLRMVVVHHHVAPVTPREEIAGADRIYSLTLDAGEIIYTALERAVDLVIHGHMHQPFAAWVSRAADNAPFSPLRTLAIHGAGSVGVQGQHLGAIGRNSYTIFEFGGDRIDVVVRAWSQQFTGFGDHWTYSLVRNPNGGLSAAQEPTA
jgi:3',5'-cyclic AMP phosphodiesterase CpdA